MTPHSQTPAQPTPRRMTLRLSARLDAALRATAQAHGLRVGEVIRCGLAAEIARLDSPRREPSR
jgi:hypothetical protein